MNLYISNVPLPPNTLRSADDISSLQITWEPKYASEYTLIMYDVDAPYPSEPSSSPFIHLLITNIPGNDISAGLQVFPYLPPNPPSDSQPHRYVIGLYSQSIAIPTLGLTNREMFPLNKFISQYNLYMMESKIIVYDPVQRTFYLYQEQEQQAHVTFNSSHRLIRGDTTLTDEEQKYCSCVISVAEKQPSQCNLEKAWFESRDSRVCYNPWAVCAKSTGTSSRKCNENYNYNEFSDSELTAFANLSQIQTSDPLDRLGIISELMSRTK